MDETRLREQLDRLAGDAGVPDLDDRRVLGRARRRRALTGGSTALLVIAVGAAGFWGMRSVVDRPPTTLGRDPGPTEPPGVTAEGFPGLWPESDPESLTAAQAAADAGHSPLRTTAEGTAGMFATDLLGWSPDDLIVESTGAGPAGSTVVGLLNRRLVEHSPPIEIALRQLGRGGPAGVWSVVAVSSPLVEVSEPTLDSAGSTLSGIVRVSSPTGRPRVVEVRLLGLADPGSGFVRVEGTGEGASFEIAATPTAGGRATLLVTVPESGIAVGATAVDVPTPVGEPAPAIHLEGAPPDVAVTAQRLLDGVLAHDLDALAELIDPNTFVHDFDDGSDPIPGWREDPTVLDAIPGVLRLPFVIQDIRGYGTFYVWPYLMKEGALDDVTEQERADLHSLGFSDAEIEQMREFGSYIGPRLAIDADGLWRNYVTGGD
jgi:hypothetical protein